MQCTAHLVLQQSPNATLKTTVRGQIGWKVSNSTQQSTVTLGADPCRSFDHKVLASIWCIYVSVYVQQQ